MRMYPHYRSTQVHNGPLRDQTLDTLVDLVFGTPFLDFRWHQELSCDIDYGIQNFQLIAPGSVHSAL
jgi:hypothetical protein